MIIDKDITKNESKITTLLNSTIIAYIKNQIRMGETTVKTSELINECYHAIGYRDEVLANNDVRERVNLAIDKCLTKLEQVEAIGVGKSLISGFKSFIELKKNEHAFKVRELSINKPSTYEISPDFGRKITLLKTNEKILNSGKAVFFTGHNDVSVVVIKNASLSNVKECNLLFDYQSCGNYLGCLNSQTNMVDLIATKPEPKRFFATNKGHVIPVERDMENLYYIINFSEEYKTMFVPDNLKQSPTAVAKKDLKYSTILATNSKREVYAIN